MGRSQFSSSLTLDESVDRAQVIAFLQSHSRMIELNPLSIRHEQGDPPSKVPREEASNMIWYDVTDKIQYLPGIAVAATEVTFKAGFQNLPDGLRTHVFAPGGVEIHGRWTVVGDEAPLQLKEEGELNCFPLLTSFVKKNLEKSHRVVAEKLAAAHAKRNSDAQPECDRPFHQNTHEPTTRVLTRSGHFTASPVALLLQSSTFMDRT